jgi:pimeloyl-ACP methyl ester carboxylesterase
VLALDYPGHGQSEYDRSPDNYTLPVALADLSAVLIALEIAPAIFIGQQHARKIKTSTPLSRWAGPN